MAKTCEVKCRSCGKVEKITVDTRGYKLWNMGMSIQQALPKAHELERAALTSNMCLDCLSKIYNQPKPGEDWGPIVLECPCCGADLYERHRNKDGVIVCPSCYSEYPEV